MLCLPLHSTGLIYRWVINVTCHDCIIREPRSAWTYAFLFRAVGWNVKFCQPSSIFLFFADPLPYFYVCVFFSCLALLYFSQQPKHYMFGSHPPEDLNGLALIWILFALKYSFPFLIKWDLIFIQDLCTISSVAGHGLLIASFALLFVRVIKLSMVNFSMVARSSIQTILIILAWGKNMFVHLYQGLAELVHRHHLLC